MARQVHTAQIPLGSIGDYSVANAADYVYLAADVANKEETILTGKELILVRNVDASPHTVTINSEDDPFNRKEDVAAYSVGANEFAMFGPFDRTGWVSGGKLNFEADNVNIEFAVIRLPA